MAHPHWPLFDLEVSTPRLMLRYLDDELGTRLATLAAGGIHDPAFMPFALPWTDAESPDLEREAMRFYWRCRADTRPDRWNVILAVLVDGTLVGSTSLSASDFAVARSFETGSWLGRDHQGRGIGTEMRLATLHVGFLAFDAVTATTGAFEDNAPSLAVTRTLGYAPNGFGNRSRRDELARIAHFRMERDHFLATLRRDDVVISGDEGARELLGIRR